MKKISLTLALPAILCTACTTNRQPDILPEPTVIPEVKSPIWAYPERPNPLDTIYLTPKEKKTVNLRGSISVAPFEIEASSLDSSLISDQPDQETVVISSEDPGRNLISITDQSSGETVTFPVVIEPLPLISFSYDPDGKDVSKVALAGDFNGWSNSADLFTKDDDGIFRIEKAISPGVWNYKLVIDGEWVPDPSNPKQDSSGFNNSVLEVEGDARETFAFHSLSSAMPGANENGGFQAVLLKDERLLADSVTVIVNNQLQPPDAWTLSEDGRTITLTNPSPWFDENYVTLIATSTEGREGEVTVPVDFASAPRSPRDEVIYYAFTDRFHDGDLALNNPSDDERLHRLTNYMGGDFAGIRQKIEEGYFEDLGVTTIWIAPVNKNTPKVEQESVEPGRYFTSYHGYWPISSTETNVQFGSMEELKSLVNSAHERDTAILLDYVVNHVHEDHPLIRERPELAVPLKLEDGSNNIRQFDAHPLTTWFDTFLPTLNYADNQDVVELMTDNAIWWLETTGADGFRHDAVKHIPTGFWKTLTAKLEEKYHRDQNQYVYQVGETISGHDTVVQYIGPELMPGQFDFPTYFTIQSVLARGNGTMVDLAKTNEEGKRWYPAGSIMSPLIGNHDVARFMGYADGDLPPGVDEKEIGFTNPPQVDNMDSYDKLQLGFALLTALPGPPTIYYGDEIGLTGAHDPDNRRPMPWKRWTPQQQATHDNVSALLNARLDSVALRRGSTEILFGGKERLVIAKTSAEETVIVMLSRTPETNSLSMTLPESWGTPSSLERITTKGLEGALSDNRLQVMDGPYSYGIWRVTW